ncbi:phosphoenolpyruvate mutase [Guptibacillus hwajinpoensis]|uniref:phosphoenolpyruvate mutase n=1 Tax=Guptibacillus hwajinpoensis TaxID=208199 RepID=UPI0037358731
MRKTTQLRNIITSSSLEYIMEAHHALSAKIVEEAGFKGIWGSGLSISASLGVRDNNEASWTQVLDVLEFMSDATSIPILLDGDTGYGNFNNARRLVKKLEQRDIAGVCIEDKIFPKTNSFIKGEAQPLARIDEFCGKIKAMKDSQTDDDFVVVSRVEALIAGWGLQEALKRAEAYRLAGSDAILMHSKRSDSLEIEAFMKEWGDRLPVVIVPTKYYSVPTERFRDIGVSVAIWANHNLRASIKAMQRTSNQIFLEESLANVEGNVTSVDEIFQLQGAEELAHAESIYLKGSEATIHSIILNKGVENQQTLTDQIAQLKSHNIHHVSVIGDTDEDGEGASMPQGDELEFLHRAKEKINGDVIISHSEMMYKPHVLTELLATDHDISIIVDVDYDANKESGYYVKADIPYSRELYDQSVNLVEVDTSLSEDQIHGEFFGLWRVKGKGAEVLKESLEILGAKSNFDQLTFADLLNHIQSSHSISVTYIKSSWLDCKTYLSIRDKG